MKTSPTYKRLKRIARNILLLCPLCFIFACCHFAVSFQPLHQPLIAPSKWTPMTPPRGTFSRSGTWAFPSSAGCRSLACPAAAPRHLVAVPTASGVTTVRRADGGDPAHIRRHARGVVRGGDPVRISATACGPERSIATRQRQDPKPRYRAVHSSRGPAPRHPRSVASHCALVTRVWWRRSRAAASRRLRSATPTPSTSTRWARPAPPRSGPPCGRGERL